MTAAKEEKPPRAIKLVGGQLSLDFANTVSYRGRQFPEEKLNGF